MGIHRSKKGIDSKVLVPITPMLDFTFQLLFFFILTSKPSLPEGEMDLALPTDKPTLVNTNMAEQVTNPLSQDEEPKDLPEVTVLIDTYPGGDKTGKIQEIFLVLNNKPEERINVTADGWDADNPRPLLQKLTEQLKKLRDTLSNKNDIIMKGDRKLKWQAIVQVRDACENAGFKNAHFSRK